MRINKAIKIAGWVMGALVGLVVVATVVGYALPEEVQWVDTSATLDASSEELFPLFNSRDGQQRLWTRASERGGADADPPMKIVDLGGPDAGVGTRLGFFPADGQQSLRAVAGEGVILESEPGRKVVYSIDFGVVVAHRTIELEAQGEHQTQVHWSETLRATNPLMRYPLLLGGDPSINEGFHAVLLAAQDLTASD